ncbi:hypothetical protein SSX86_033226, partial [Deinandra increscens subsp. villosa]
MASQNPRNLYPQILQSNPDSSSLPTPSAPSLYPSLDIHDLNEDLFPEDLHLHTSEEVVVKIPKIVHLIDKQQSIELASGALEIVRLRQGDAVVAVLARRPSPPPLPAKLSPSPPLPAMAEGPPDIVAQFRTGGRE